MYRERERERERDRDTERERERERETAVVTNGANQSRLLHVTQRNVVW